MYFRRKLRACPERKNEGDDDGGVCGGGARVDGRRSTLRPRRGPGRRVPPRGASHGRDWRGGIRACGGRTFLPRPPQDPQPRALPRTNPRPIAQVNLQTVAPGCSPCTIKVIGVGGGGGNTLNRMVQVRREVPRSPGSRQPHAPPRRSSGPFRSRSTPLLPLPAPERRAHPTHPVPRCGAPPGWVVKAAPFARRCTAAGGASHARVCDPARLPPPVRVRVAGGTGRRALHFPRVRRVQHRHAGDEGSTMQRSI